MMWPPMDMFFGSTGVSPAPNDFVTAETAVQSKRLHDLRWHRDVLRGAAEILFFGRDQPHDVVGDPVELERDVRVLAELGQERPADADDLEVVRDAHARAASRAAHADDAEIVADDGRR